MMTIYEDGKLVETLTDEEAKVLAKLAGRKKELEIRDDTGTPLVRVVPESVEDWEPNLTAEEVQRRLNAPGAMTLDEFWRKMGVK